MQGSSLESPSRMLVSLARQIKEDLPNYINSIDTGIDSEGHLSLVVEIKPVTVDSSLYRYITEVCRKNIEDFFGDPFKVELVVIQPHREIKSRSSNPFSLTYDRVANSFALRYYTSERIRSNPFVIPLYYRKIMDQLRLLAKGEKTEVIWQNLFNPTYEMIAKQRGIKSFTAENLANLFHQFLIQNYGAFERLAKSKGDKIPDLHPEIIQEPEETREDFEKKEISIRADNITEKNPRPAVIGWIDPQRIKISHLFPEFYAPEYLEVEEQVESCRSKYEVKPLDKIGKFVTGPFGSQLPTSLFVPKGIPLLRVQNISELEIVRENLAYISPETHQKLISSRLQSGDLAIAKAGRIGMTAVIPKSIPECNITEHIIGVKVEDRTIDNYYLAAFLASKYGRLQLIRRGVGTLLKYLGVSDAREAQIVIPDPLLQENIGNKVKLAEQCRKEASTIWERSKQLLSEAVGLPLDTTFFEDFESELLRTDSYWLICKTPVILRAGLQAVDRELGPQFFHPRRINIIQRLQKTSLHLEYLGDIAPRISERSSDHLDLLYVGLAEINSETGYFEVDLQKAYKEHGAVVLFQKNDILFSRLRPYLNKVSICPPNLSQGCGSTEFFVYRPEDRIAPYYLFFFLKSNFALYQIIDITVGSTLPRLDSEVVDQVLVPRIASELEIQIDKNTRQVFFLLNKASQLIKEARTAVEKFIDSDTYTDANLSRWLTAPTWESIMHEFESYIANK